MQLQGLPAGNRTRFLWITRPVLYHWATEAVADNLVEVSYGRGQTRSQGTKLGRGKRSSVRSSGDRVKPNMAANGGPNLRQSQSPYASELYKDWNDTCKPNFEAFVEADMQVIPSPP